MSQDIKAEIKSNLRKIFGNRDWRDEDIILDKVALTPDLPTWSNLVPGVVHEGINSRVRVERNAYTSNAAQASPQIHTVKESDVIGKVTLRQGVKKGLNKMLLLPLNGTVFSSILGNAVKINLGREITELKKDKMTIAVSVEVNGQSASATVRTMKTIYRGSFQCKVKLSGPVLIDDPDGVIQQDISNLTTNPIQVTGELEFLWDKEQHVNMLPA